MASNPNLAELARLLADLRVQHEKTGELIEEVASILGGTQPSGELLKLAETHYQQCWSSRYPGTYVWSYVKDRPQMKRLVKALGLPELQHRMTNYLRNDDPFYGKTRHGFGMFVASINSHARQTSLDADVQRDTARTQQTVRSYRREGGV